MSTHKTFIRLATAAAVCGAVALPASSAFASEKTERAIFGALLGGLAGAALSHGDGGGVALGAVAGAALGASTAKNHDYRSSYYEPAYRSSYYAPARYDRRDYGRDRYDSYGRYDTRYVYGR